MRPKVFGIGLSKTGTSSLAEALNILGIRTIHYPNDPQTYSELRNGNFDLTLLREYNAIADTPVVPYYPQFDTIFPGSKFILTIREKNSWLTSVEKHWQAATTYPDEPLKREFQQFIRTAVYGCIDFNRERFSYVYDQHMKNVLAYFAHRPEDLLVMNICSGEGWDRLCPFLGVPVPEIPFPHANEWMTRLVNATQQFESTVPSGSKVILIDDNLLGDAFGQGRQLIPFIENNGMYHGPPANDRSAIAAFDRTLQTHTPTHVAIAWPSYWWLEHYPAWAAYLHSKTDQLAATDELMIYKVR